MNVQMIEQATFPGFPAPSAIVEKESPVAMFLRLNRECGGLIPVWMLPGTLEVSNQRVSQYVNERRFRVVEIDGKKFVPADALAHFLTLERRTGRPCKPKALDFVRSVLGAEAG